MLYSSTIVKFKRILLFSGSITSTSTDHVCVTLNLIRATSHDLPRPIPYHLPVLISVQSKNVFLSVTDSALDCGVITVVRAGRVVLQRLGREDARRQIIQKGHAGECAFGVRPECVVLKSSLAGVFSLGGGWNSKRASWLLLRLGVG